LDPGEERDAMRMHESPATAPTAAVVGRVVPGDRRGRTIGFPTANLAVDPATTPHGVYAGYVARADGTLHPAAVNVGRRPTFEHDGVVLLEAHLVDFDDDLYGETITVHLVAFLRPERRLPSIDALVEQLRADVAAVRSLLATPVASAALVA